MAEENRTASRRSAVPDFLEGLGRLAKVVNDALAPLVPVLQLAKERWAAAAPILLEAAAEFHRTGQLFAEWERDAPRVLKEAIAARGMIVPFAQMSFADLKELLEVHRAQGDSGVVQRIADLYEGLFASPGFLDEIGAVWAADRHLSRRFPLLEEALKAHALRMYGVSIPTLIAQFEGLVVDIVGHVGRMNGNELKAHVDALAQRESVSGQMFSSFVHDALLDKFAHGSLVPPFSRHAILHGGDVTYATEVNSRTAILLIDNVREIAGA